MADNVTKERRSEIMAGIRSINTKPELIVRRFLFVHGLRFRLHDKALPSKPDIKLTKYKTLVFVNGCFWHGHKNCKRYVMPKTNKKFWYEKIRKNIKRDKKNLRELRKMGWHVYIIWECDLQLKNRSATLDNLLRRVLRNA